MYGPHLVCVLVLQYLWLEKEGKAKARAEKQLTSSESSQIDAIKMQRKKCRSANFNLRMQKGSKKGLLKILKDHEDLQESALKAGENNLKNFRSNLKPPKGLPESFEDASKRKIEPKALNEDFNENQLEAE